MKHVFDRIARMVRGSPEPTAPASSVAGNRTGGESIHAAIASHQAGRLDEAERIYREVLAREPAHFDALHLSGVIALQRGNTAQAVELMARAIAINPDSPIALGNLAAAYQGMTRYGDAEAALRKAIALKPDWDGAHNKLGVLYQAMGDPDRAEAAFRDALALNPASADALNNLAGTLKDRGQLDDAAAWYRKALALEPAAVAAWTNLGGVLQQQGNLAQAEECYRRALLVSPDDAPACNGLGSVCQRQGRLAEAESWLRKALDNQPDMAEAAANLGDVLQATGMLEEAEAWCRQALAARPGYAEALNNLGTICKKTGRLDEAEACYRQALASNPGHAPAHTNLGIVASEQGRLDEADAWFRKAMQLDPQDARIKYNLAMLLLLRGDYRQGLPLYESRFDAFTYDFRGSRGLHDQLESGRRWRGESLSGQRLLVWSEQGLGDSLMAMRYLPALKHRGVVKLLVYCDPALRRVMQAMPGVDQVFADAEPPPSGQFDVHCPIMSLPHLFDAQLDAMSGQVPYLGVPGALVDQWRGRLSRTGAPKRIGLAWAGSRDLRDDARRSIPLERFAPLLALPHVQWFSLQKGEASAQLEGHRGAIVDHMDDCGDFLDTAALVANLDLVISIDTAVAHLAGALGKPVWLLNRFASEWRWGLAREDTPWYPTMRIFREPAPDSWGDVIERIAAELERS